MLFVHFTPKSNLKRIKRVGLVPGKEESGVFLRPLIQGEKTFANDWAHPFWWDPGSRRRTREMAKIIVRLPPDALIRWGDCGGSRFAEPITVREFGKVMKSWQEELDPRRRLCDPKFCSHDLPQPGVVQTWSGLEVLYEGKIPPKWIVKILDHKDTDERTRAYRRKTRRSECQE